MKKVSSLNEILEVNCSFQSDTWSEIKEDVFIKNILSDIKHEKYGNQIKILRDELLKGNKEFYDSHKKKLPAVTFSGSFKTRRINANLNQYNPIIVIDIDKLDIESMINVKSVLKTDDFVFSFWKSPSNNGFKGLVPLSYELENTEDIDYDFLHKCAFKKLSNYFLEKYNIELDKSGSDITRLCFISADNELILKEDAIFFKISSEDLIINSKTKSKLNQTIKFASSQDVLNNPANKNNPNDRKLMSDIIRFLNNKGKSITKDYNSWCKVAMAISNAFTYNIGVKYFKKLSILDGEKYNEVNCENFLINCYENRKGEVNFSTIIYLANKEGYKTKNQKNGVPKVKD